jgi:YjbE family integral membrane protein
MPETIGWDFVIRFLNITLIDIALSGDNAIIIGMAAASLPRGKRKWAIIIGGFLAIALRIALTSVATILMLVPYLSATGGLVLMWVVYRLLKIDVSESEEQKKAKEAANFRQAIILILTADFMMSLDNVIAVAGSAHGNIVLLVAGLLLSMPLLMVAGGAVSALIDKAKWLLYVGAAAISFTAARMILEDRLIAGSLELHGGIVVAISVVAAVLLPLGFVYAPRLAPRRQG